MTEVVADAADHGDQAVLAHFGLSRSRLIGSGGESEVFALDDQRVLRLYRSTHEAPQTTSEQLRELYDLWADSPAATAMPLELPRILDAGEIGGRRFTVDRRMSGIILSDWLPRAGVEERRKVLGGYLQAAASLHLLPSPTRTFARLIGEDRREFSTLAELLTDQLGRAVQRSQQRLEQDLPEVAAVWDRLQSALVERTCEPKLVHGDYCAPNVYLSRDAVGRPVVTGVGDFSPHTLNADPLLDVTGAVAFLELESYPGAAEDAAWLTAWPSSSSAPARRSGSPTTAPSTGSTSRTRTSSIRSCTPGAYGSCAPTPTADPPGPTPPAAAGSAASTADCGAANPAP